MSIFLILTSFFQGRLLNERNGKFTMNYLWHIHSQMSLLQNVSTLLDNDLSRSEFSDTVS